MNVLMVVPAGLEFGGVAEVVRSLVRYLRERGHEVVLLSPGSSFRIAPRGPRWGADSYELRLQLPFGSRSPLVSLLAFSVLFPLALVELVRFLRKHRFGVVNVHYPADTAAYLALCRRILPFNLVTSIHGAEVFPGGGAARPSRLLRLLLAASDRIITPSRAACGAFVQAFPRLNAKTVWVHNGVDPAELADAASQPAPAGRYILTVSACKEQKGLDVLVRAAALLPRSDPEVRTVIVGEGHLRESLEELAVALGVRDRIDFLGRTNRRQVSALLRGCEVFVLPSRFETFGIALVEALACGKPVVATRVGGIPEIVEHCRTGLLVEPDRPEALAAALGELLRNRELRQRLAARGAEQVQRHFRYDATGAAYESYFVPHLVS